MIINENNMLIKYFEEDIDIVKEKHQVSKSNQIQLVLSSERKMVWLTIT